MNKVINLMSERVAFLKAIYNEYHCIRKQHKYLNKSASNGFWCENIFNDLELKKKKIICLEHQLQLNTIMYSIVEDLHHKDNTIDHLINNFSLVNMFHSDNSNEDIKKETSLKITRNTDYHINQNSISQPNHSQRHQPDDGYSNSHLNNIDSIKYMPNVKKKKTFLSTNIDDNSKQNCISNYSQKLPRPIPKLSKYEFESLPSHMKSTITHDIINSTINNINNFLYYKYQIMTVKYFSALSYEDKRHYLKWNKLEIQDSLDKFWFYEDDLNLFYTAESRSEKSSINTLNHLQWMNRLTIISPDGIVRYCLTGQKRCLE